MNLYIVHNSFSLFLVSFWVNGSDSVVIANKNAKKLHGDYSGLIKTHFFIYDSVFFNWRMAMNIFKCDSVYVSSCLHRRMIFLWLIIFIFRKKVILMDEGVATINDRYSELLSEGLNKVLFAFLLFFSRTGKERLLKTIFDEDLIPDNFKEVCNVGSVETLSEMKVVADKESKNFVERIECIFLGSPSLSAEELFRRFSRERGGDVNDMVVKLKDHPLCEGEVEDDLGCSPEVYLIKNHAKVKLICGAGSSALVVASIFFPSIGLYSVNDFESFDYKIGKQMKRRGVCLIG